MTSAKQKNLAAVSAVSLLYLIFLLNHFSVMGIITTAATITYLFVRNYATMKETKCGILDYIGQFWGASVCNCMLCMLFCFGASFKEIQFYGASSGIFWAAIMLTGFSIFILRKLHNEYIAKKKIITYIAKYAILLIGAYFLLQTFVGWNPEVLIYFLITYLAIDIFVEQIYAKYCNADNKNVAFNWTLANIILFAVVEYLFPWQSIEIIGKVCNLALIQWKWYTIVLVAFAAVAVGIFSWSIDSKEKNYPNDCKLCLAVGIDLIMIPFSMWTYTRFNVIWFLALAILNFVLFFGKCKGSKYIKLWSYSVGRLELIFVLGSIAVAVLSRAYILGWVYSALIFFASLICGFLLYRYKSGAKGWLFWEFIVLAAGALSCEVVYRTYNATQSYKYIIFVVVLASVALAIMNVKNPLNYTANKGLKLMITICAAILILFPVRNLGISYQIKVDNKIAQSDVEMASSLGESNNIMVKVKARGKENSISRCYYYWNGETENIVEVIPDENSVVTIEPRNGRLHIYGEDQYGVSSTKMQWFEFNHLWEPKQVAYPKGY